MTLRRRVWTTLAALAACFPATAFMTSIGGGPYGEVAAPGSLPAAHDGFAVSVSPIRMTGGDVIHVDATGPSPECCSLFAYHLDELVDGRWLHRYEGQVGGRKPSQPIRVRESKQIFHELALEIGGDEPLDMHNIRLPQLRPGAYRVRTMIYVDPVDPSSYLQMAASFSVV